MVQAQLGYAADDLGNGIAYVRLTTPAGERLVRVAFRAKRFDGLAGREIGYAALTAVAALLAERKIERIRLRVPDAELVADCTSRRDVPPPLVIPYVGLGCALNRFSSFALESAQETDLDARARAELFVHTAA
jgi:hypothetical protein